MKLEQYKAAYVPQGVRDVPYRWHKPAEKSGFNIGGLIEGIGNGAASLLGAANDSAQKILKMKEKLQDERDETEAKTISMEMQAEQNTFDVTLDEEKDNERLEQMREKYTQKVYQNKTLSGRAQQAMLEGIDRSFSIQKIRIDGSRMKLIDNQHTVQLKSLMQDAIRNGDLEGARGNYDALATKGVALPAWDIVKSQTVYYNNMAALSEMPSQKLYEENLFATEQLRNGKEIDGMSRSDSLLYAKQTHAVLADRNRNDILLYGDLMRQKKITFAELKDKHGAGELTDSAFETLRRDAAKEEYNAILGDADSVLFAAAMKEISETDCDGALAIVRANLDRQEELGLFSKEDVKDLKTALDRKDITALKQKEELRKQTARTAGGSLRYEIQTVVWPKDIQARNRLEAELKDRILKNPFLDYGQRGTLSELVDSRRKNAENPAYRQSEAYRTARSYVKDLVKKGKLTYDPWGLFNKESGKEFQQMRGSELLDLLDEYAEQNPNTEVEEFYGYIDKQVARLNAGEVRKFVRERMGDNPDVIRAAPVKTPEAPAEGTTGTYRGHKVIFRKGKWEYAE